jgi:FkbM family methyltransferase
MLHKWVARQLRPIIRPLWYLRSKSPYTNVPLPCPLPYGGWFLAHGDALGLSIAGYRFHNNPLEEGSWKFVKQYLKKGMTVIDVGANQGFYAILASKCVGPCGKVYAFEPAPTECGKLRRNLRLNRLGNVEVIPAALGLHDGVTDFYHCLGHQGSFSSIREPAGDVTCPMRLIQVPTMSLDHFADKMGLGPIHLVKVDAEGGELEILRGGNTTIAKWKPVILCEVAGQRTKQWGYTPEELFAYLAGMGYKWHRPLTDGGIEPVALQEAGDITTDNLIAIPSS